MKASITTLSSKGQLVIPQPIRDRLQLEPGIQFSVEIEDETIILTPIDYISKIDLLYGMFANGPDLIADLEAEHQQEIESE